MCAPSMPSMPEMPKPQAPMETAKPLIKDPVLPTPAPQLVDGGSKADTGIKQRKSKRQSLQQSGAGAGALRIPLNTGVPNMKSKSGSLNIPS